MCSDATPGVDRHSWPWKYPDPRPFLDLGNSRRPPRGRLSRRIGRCDDCSAFSIGSFPSRSFERLSMVVSGVVWGSRNHRAGNTPPSLTTASNISERMCFDDASTLDSRYWLHQWDNCALFLNNYVRCPSAGSDRGQAIFFPFSVVSLFPLYSPYRRRRRGQNGGIHLRSSTQEL